jgi:hypothetical protein
MHRMRKNHTQECENPTRANPDFLVNMTFNHTQRVEIQLVRVKITLVRVLIKFIRIKFTLVCL